MPHKHLRDHVVRKNSWIFLFLFGTGLLKLNIWKNWFMEISQTFLHYYVVTSCIHLHFMSILSLYALRLREQITGTTLPTDQVWPQFGIVWPQIMRLVTLQYWCIVVKLAVCHRALKMPKYLGQYYLVVKMLWRFLLWTDYFTFPCLVNFYRGILESIAYIVCIFLFKRNIWI